ncbi:hypothetical protein [Flindersiella endophytica]
MGQVRPRAAVLSTIGAAGIGASAYFVWLTSRTPEQIPLRKLLFVGDVTGDATSYWQSMAAPLVVISALCLIGALALSRLVLLIGLLLGATTVGLWVATDLLDVEGGLQLNSIGRTVGVGAWVCLGALVVLLIGLVSLRRRGDEEDEEYDEEEDEGLTRPVPPRTTDLAPSATPFSPLPKSYQNDD